MKTTKVVFGILTVTGALVANIQAQTSNLIATLMMDFTQPQTLTTPVLRLGANYSFLVTGRYGTGPGDRGEAEEDAAFGTVITTTLDQYHVAGHAWAWNGTFTNRPNPDIYRTNHVYHFDFEGRGAAEVLSFADGGTYADNIGTLTFELYEMAQTQSFLTNGLVAYYPFNGNANDASGNGNNGVAYNVAYGQNRFGVAGAAAAFNGSSSFVYVTNFFSSQPIQITYSIWFASAGQLTMTNASFSLAGATTGNLDGGWDYGFGIQHPQRVGANGPIIGDDGFGLYKYFDLVSRTCGWNRVREAFLSCDTGLFSLL